MTRETCAELVIWSFTLQPSRARKRESHYHRKKEKKKNPTTLPPHLITSARVLLPTHKKRKEERKKNKNNKDSTTFVYTLIIMAFSCHNSKKKNMIFCFPPTRSRLARCSIHCRPSAQDHCASANNNKKINSYVFKPGKSQVFVPLLFHSFLVGHDQYVTEAESSLALVESHRIKRRYKHAKDVWWWCPH